MDLEDGENRKAADQVLEEAFQVPLFGYAYPPKASVCLESLHKDSGNHQDQVKELIKKTAGSLDDVALKILFVSVQKNNLELCMEYAVNYAFEYSLRDSMEELVIKCLEWFNHIYISEYKYEHTEKDNYARLQLQQQRHQYHYYHYHYYQQLFLNSSNVITLLNAMHSKSSPLLFVEVVICAENSFWHKSTSAGFIDAYKEASKLYQVSARDRAAISLQSLGAYPSEELLQVKFKSDLLKLILEHRLAHN